MILAVKVESAKTQIMRQESEQITIKSEPISRELDLAKILQV